MEKLAINALDLLPPQEADIKQYFGKIRNGKTYIATSDILDELNSGGIVYANWRVQWAGRDERTEFLPRLLGAIGLKRHFIKYPASNFHYLPVTEQFFNIFPMLTDCSVWLDEGHIAFNSYEMTRMKLDKQASILHTGHFDRSIRIISQRPTAIHVVMRANVNIFVKCEKVLDLFGIKIFRKTEYEEITSDESVDLDQPARSQYYIGKKKIYNAYNTKYLRGDTPPSQIPETELWYIKWVEQIKKLGKKLV